MPTHAFTGCGQSAGLCVVWSISVVLAFLRGTAAGPDGPYVADSSNDRVQVIFAEGAFLMGWGSEGCAQAQFNIPRELVSES